jgi:segregation and condensation protein A
MTEMPSCLLGIPSDEASSVMARLQPDDQNLTDLFISPLLGEARAWLALQPRDDLELHAEVVCRIARLLAAQSGRLLALPADEDGEDLSPETWDPAAMERVRTLAVLLREHEGDETFPGPIPAGLPERPVEPRAPSILLRAWNEMRDRARLEAVRVPVLSFVSLETALSDFIRRLRGVGRLSFKQVLGRCDRQEAVVRFLALLELVRQRRAVAAQDALFDEIMIERPEAEVDGGARAAG